MCQLVQIRLQQFGDRLPQTRAPVQAPCGWKWFHIFAIGKAKVKNATDFSSHEDPMFSVMWLSY